ncbi:MAG: glycosyltransferase family 4 protein [Muribaculaceae bacterium]|nr:glycosyltransferase family 4 protein [Muribaculaceae bacterium]
MRVVVAIPCLLHGGTEVQTLALVQALRAAGHEVGVACYFEWDARMVENFRRAGAEVFILSESGVRPKGLWPTFRFLRRHLREVTARFRPDVAHVQYMTPGALAVIIFRMLGVKDILATLHTGADIYSCNGLKVVRFLTHRILTATQCISQTAERSFFGDSTLLTASESSARAVLPKHFTIYNALPSHITLATSPRRHSGTAPLTVGVVSRLAHIKGMDLVVPAFINALSVDSRLRLLIAGDGPLRKEMERQVAEAGLSSYVNFTGLVKAEDLERIYDRIDILLMPSRSEGFGLTLIEGMARGCVPVVADVGGLPEVLGPELAGLLHKAESPEDIAAKILEASRSRERLDRYSSVALERARHFSREAYGAAVKSLYSHL